MTSKYMLGQVFEDYYGDEVARIIFLDGAWSSEEDKQAYLEEMNELPEHNDAILYEDYYNDEFIEGDNYIEEFVNEHGLIDPVERERKDKERQHIVDTLKSLGVNTRDFIVSDDRVYIGNDECCAYIQGTHAWCSSSMTC